MFVPDRSLADVTAELRITQAELEELQSDGVFNKTVDDVDADLQGVRDFLDKNVSEINEASEKLGEEYADLSEMSKELSELLGSDGVKEAVSDAIDSGTEVVEGVQGGIESTTNVLSQVQEGLDSLAEALEILKAAGDLTGTDGAQQLEAFADAFELVVSKLEKFIDLVPGLGAFFQLYAAGIRNIAESARVLEQVVNRNQSLYQQVRPGQHLYLTPSGMRANKIRALEHRYAQLRAEGIRVAGDERTARDALDAGTASSVDIVLAAALRASAGARPEIDSTAHRDWVEASNSLDSANASRIQALGEHWGAADELARAKIKLDSAGAHSDVAALQSTYDMAVSAVDRSARKLSEANAHFDTALVNQQAATAGHRAEIDVYNEAVKTEIFRVNAYEHLTDGELATLAVMYPQWDIRGWEPAAAAGAVAGAGAASTGITGTTGVVGGAVGAGGTTTGAKKIVLIGGGGVLAGMILLGGILIMGGGEETSENEVALPADAAAAETTVPTTAPPATTTSAPVVAVEPPALSDAHLAPAWTYTATKIADISFTEGPTLDPVGASFPGLLIIEEACVAGECTYESRYDLERMLFGDLEYGEREPGIWERDGSSWSVETLAHTGGDTGFGGACVQFHRDTWEVSVEDAEFIGEDWTAVAFTGTVVRGTGKDATLSTAGEDYCPDWHATAEWTVEGVAIVDR